MFSLIMPLGEKSLHHNLYVICLLHLQCCDFNYFCLIVSLYVYRNSLQRPADPPGVVGTPAEPEPPPASTGVAQR